MSQFIVALSPPSFEFLGLVPGFADQDRYERDDEEGRVEVGDEVRFAVGVVRKDCLADMVSLHLRSVSQRVTRSLTLARKLETVQRKTVTNKSSKPTERLHFAQLEAFTFQPPGVSCSCVVEVAFPRGFSKACAALAGIGGSRLAMMCCRDKSQGCV